MIYEVRTLNLKPGAVAEFENRFAEAYEHRKKYSELAAFWHTEIGPLNQIVAVWPYKDLEDRKRIREAAAKDSNWPAKTGEFVLSAQADIVTLTPFSPELKPAKMGPFFEMRTYTVPVGEFPLMIENWTFAMPRRLTFSPVCAVLSVR